MQQKKLPERLCLGCNEMKPKRELIRIVRSPQGEISLDRTGKAAGRGAYICPDKACLAKLRKNRRLARALSCELPPDIYERLEAELGNE